MNRSLFDFKPSAWLPVQDKEVLEHCRNIRREEMEITNENGYSIRVIPHPSYTDKTGEEGFDWYEVETLGGGYGYVSSRNAALVEGALPQ